MRLSRLTLAVALSALMPAMPIVAQQAPAESPSTVVVAPADNGVPAPDVTTLDAVPVIRDYWFSADLAEGKTVLSGYVPNAATKSVLAARDGVDPSGLKLGQGEPAFFDAAVEFGLNALSRLSSGHFAIRSSVITLKGQAKSADDYTAVKAMLADRVPSGAVLAMGEIAEPPAPPAPAAVEAPAAEPAITVPAPAPLPEEEKIADYWFAADLADGKTALSGYVPNAATKSVLASRDGVDPSGLKLGQGAPAFFDSAVEFGLKALSHLSSGHFAIRSSIITLKGQAKSADDYAAVKAMLVSDAPAGAVIAMAEITEPPAPATAEATPAPQQPQAPAPAYTFGVARAEDGTVTLSGNVPSDVARNFFAQSAGDNVVNQLGIVAGAPEDFVVNAQAGIAALNQLESGKLALVDGKWSLTGKAADKPSRQAALGAIADLSDASAWTSDISLPPPIELCRAELAGVSGRNAILFDAGSARITADSSATLDEVATDLNDCPDAVVHVEGHTDSDGPADYNMALSVQRAEAVIKGLIDRGIDPKRLYAVGYGETLPIATNDTAAGKAKNRRIVITIPDKAE